VIADVEIQIPEREIHTNEDLSVNPGDGTGDVVGFGRYDRERRGDSARDSKCDPGNN
jgi:hypothetical protein